MADTPDIKKVLHAALGMEHTLQRLAAAVDKKEGLRLNPAEAEMLALVIFTQKNKTIALEEQLTDLQSQIAGTEVDGAMETPGQRG